MKTPSPVLPLISIAREMALAALRRSEDVLYAIWAVAAAIEPDSAVSRHELVRAVAQAGILSERTVREHLCSGEGHWWRVDSQGRVWRFGIEHMCADLGVRLPNVVALVPAEHLRGVRARRGTLIFTFTGERPISLATIAEMTGFSMSAIRSWAKAAPGIEVQHQFTRRKTHKSRGLRPTVSLGHGFRGRGGMEFDQRPSMFLSDYPRRNRKMRRRRGGARHPVRKRPAEPSPRLYFPSMQELLDYKGLTASEVYIARGNGLWKRIDWKTAESERRYTEANPPIEGPTFLDRTLQRLRTDTLERRFLLALRVATRFAPLYTFGWQPIEVGEVNRLAKIGADPFRKRLFWRTPKSCWFRPIDGAHETVLDWLTRCGKFDRRWAPNGEGEEVREYREREHHEQTIYISEAQSKALS